MPKGILLGADLNCYGMARAFYEAGYGRCEAYGKYRLGITQFSRFVRCHADRRMESEEGRLALLRRVGRRLRGQGALLVGCTDEYASFLIRNREELSDFFTVPSPPATALPYADKEIFRLACCARHIPTPRTVPLLGACEVPSSLPFPMPCVLKPATSEAYWRTPFPGMRKVYYPKSREEAEQIRRQIRAAGYRDAILLQEKIPGEESENFVLTVYCDRNARVRAAVCGRVLCEEHTPRGMGNHAAILTCALPPISEGLFAFLEEIGYCGFANFDLFRNAETGEMPVLEMNLRQGRSNHYMTAASCNPAELLVRDWIEKERLSFRCGREEILWYSIPLPLVLSRLTDDTLRLRCRRAIEQGRAVSALHAAADLNRNRLRMLFLREHERRIFKRAIAEGARR